MITYLAVLLSVFLYLIGIILRRTDFILVSVAIVHILYLTVLSDIAPVVMIPKSFGIAIQMIGISVAFLLMHTFAIMGEIGRKSITVTNKNIVLEGINLVLLLVGPLIMSIIFLFTSQYLFNQVSKFILSFPEPMNNVLYIYFFNPISQLFTALAILGGMVWIFKNLFEPFLITIRLTEEGAYRVIMDEYEQLKRSIERKDLKARVGRIPPDSSISNMLLIIGTTIALTMILILSMFDANMALNLFLNLISTFYRYQLHFSNGYIYIVGDVVRAPLDAALSSILTGSMTRFRDFIIWLEGLLRVLMWLLWR
jgi:hypothetical protein